MIYTELTNKALRIMFDAHRDQVDKAGMPYALHPLHVAEGMDDEASTCVALLHDVVEDAGVSLDDLACEFPPDIVGAVALLTRDPAVPYLDYVRAVGESDLARKVKLADLAHNADETRFAGRPPLPDADRARLRERYARARAILGAAERGGTVRSDER